MDKLFYFSANNLKIYKPEEKKRHIELTIQLNSWSPIYESNGFKYREKIAIDAFDKYKPIEEQSISSYLDHKMSIEHLLASTKNKSMKVIKEGEKIVATIEVNENDKQLKRVADLIEQGVIESNSFIFKTGKNGLETREIKNDKNLDYEFIYTEAELISIDPVYAGFYPQDRCRVYDKNSDKITPDILQLIKNEEEGEKMEKYKKEEEENKPNKEKSEDQENEQQEEQKENKEVKNLDLSELNKLIEEFKQLLETNQEHRVIKLEKEVQNMDEKLKIIKQAEESSENFENDFINLRKKAKEGVKLSQREQVRFFNSQLSYLDDVRVIETKLACPVKIDLNKRSLDGTTDLKGLALVETLDMPGIISEWNIVFPELNQLAQRHPLEGLNFVRKAVFIGSQSAIEPIAEGAESTPLHNQTFTVGLSPIRWSTVSSQNNALTRGPELWDKQIQDAKESIYKGIRNRFYKSLFQHADTPMPTNGSYEGGLTQEAKILTAETGKFDFDDINKLIENTKSRYGTDITSRFVIVMHPDTLNHLTREFVKGQRNPGFINLYYTDKSKTAYRGVEIITSDSYPDSTIESGKKLAVIFDRQSIVAYGLTLTVATDPYKDMSRDITNTYVSTRGEVKLIDPHVNSRFIEVK
ncbi:HK97 family phage prohead protease [Mesomycoplasma lagogenitalium]|uniref:HK97 family phage prohead protease n=1 Tax=Mesomycoplasma lagogenitalium TaxID=171286 RepID=A0ABY8LTC0_9BACT|nr:HK97 family phage prohead protease [Mesomycoplasma lagogenitalium]WGI36487.1 HK97 family phage prohead protease [Mesomycoplasma lagogenitalium]